MEKLFGNQYLSIFLHDPTHKTRELQWPDVVPSADFRPGLAEVARLARQHRVEALGADNRLVRTRRPTALAWSGNLLFNGLSELGGSRLVVVESPDAMNRMGATALVANAVPPTNLTSQFFPTTGEARAWATQPL